MPSRNGIYTSRVIFPRDSVIDSTASLLSESYVCHDAPTSVP